MACHAAAAAAASLNTLLCIFWISLSLISQSAQLSIDKERKALLDMRTGFSVAHGELSSWSDYDCSKWERVQCHNITSHVVKLDLSNLVGSTPIKNEVISSLLDLEHLNCLDLSWNNFDGAPIPGFLGLLTQLEHLDLSRGGFSGRIPHQLGNLSKMLHLALNDNNMDGEIPETIVHLRNLQFLDLSHNRISGEIPESIGNLKSLQALFLSFNNIEGVMPKTIGNLSKMSVLDLSDNRIVGAIPGTIGNLTALQNMNLSGDQISGQIPNSFSGPIPESLAAGDNGLGFLLLSNNRFSGKIPTLICKASLEIVNLSNNSFSGELPDCWSNSASLLIMDVSSNKLSGGIPTTLGRLTKLQSLHLNNNSFTGSIPSTLQQCRELTVIDLSLNELSDGIPSWIGGSLLSLRVLSLRSNKLSGEIPWQLSLIPSLQVLDLAHNNLSSSLPPSFGNFSSMATRQTGKEIAQLNSFYYTERVTITFKDLQLFLTKTLSLVTSIDLSNNNLFGEIPKELTNLHGLRFFNLSWNQFSGNIPNEIGLMGQLESLDLSENYLSGGIPSSISVLYSLSVLNLSYNNLIGRIPTGTQLQTFTNLSYMGNPRLCGEPLQIKCPSDNPPIGVPEEEDMHEDDEYGRIWYFIGFAPGFVFGFWAFMGVVMFKRSTRIKYILLIDRICCWFMHL